MNLDFSNPYLLTFLIVWELTLKGFALYFSARRDQKIWFVAVLLFNTVGLLPAVYLLFKSGLDIEKETNRLKSGATKSLRSLSRRFPHFG